MKIQQLIIIIASHRIQQTGPRRSISQEPQQVSTSSFLLIKEQGIVLSHVTLTEFDCEGKHHNIMLRLLGTYRDSFSHILKVFQIHHKHLDTSVGLISTHFNLFFTKDFRANRRTYRTIIE